MLEDDILNISYQKKTIEEITKIDRVDKFNVGLPVIDRDFGFPSGLYFITGTAGTGKTFFATWLIKQMFLLNQKKSMYISLEMSEPIMRRRILQQWSGLTQAQFDAGFSVKKAADIMYQDAIYIKKIEKNQQKIEYIKKIIESCYNIGIEMFVFDHINEITGMNDERNMVTADLWASMFVEMSNKYPKMHFLVFCQPNKQGFKQKILTLDSIKGSSVLAEKAHYFLSLNRLVPKDEFEEDNMPEDRRVIIRLDKTRNTAINHKNFLVLFDETGNFVPMKGSYESKTNA